VAPLVRARRALSDVTEAARASPSLSRTSVEAALEPVELFEGISKVDGDLIADLLSNAFAWISRTLPRISVWRLGGPEAAATHGDTGAAKFELSTDLDKTPTLHQLRRAWLLGAITRDRATRRMIRDLRASLLATVIAVARADLRWSR
jgi:hypothetical protein